MIQDHTPIEVNNFGGLFGRDSFDDSVPADHLIDSQNLITEGFEMRTRDGFPYPSIVIANLRRFHTYKREGEADRDIILDSGGNLYDLKISATPILTIAGMTDFSVCQFYNRLYISPHNGIKGLPGEGVYVYEGAGPGTVRLAGGLAPVGSFYAANSTEVGNVEKGTHVVAFVYETSSGFVTAPGPEVFPTFDADGKHKLHLTSIPIGPPGTSKRRLISTRAIETYNGDQEGHEYFFVPGGTINDNTTTDLIIDYFDAALEITADYTFDQLGKIPACLFMAPYRKRLAYGGEDANPSMVRFSKSDEPESVDALSGFTVCDPNETVGVKAGIEYRDNFYIFKGPIPGHTYTTKDNSYEPSTWPIITLDRGIGCSLNGTSQYLDAKGANSDNFLVADAAGLYAYNGSFDTANPLTGKADNWWKRINKKQFHKLQLVIDPKKLLIYITAPLDNNVEPSHILVGDYGNGMDSASITWHPWILSGGITPKSIGVQGVFATGETVFRVGGYAGNIYDQTPNNYNDNGNAFASIAQFALHYVQSGWIHSFNAARFRILGNGYMAISAVGLDNTPSINLPSIQLQTMVGEKIIPFLLVNEKCSIKIRLTQYNNNFRIRKMELFSRPLWATRA
jgi:hypothetical protein